MTAKRVEQLAEGVTLYLADCREVIQTLDGIAAVVTDPPYGVGYKGSATKHTKDEANGYLSFDDTQENIAAIIVPAVKSCIEQFGRVVLTPGVACAFLYPLPNSMGSIYYPSGANCGPWGFISSQPILFYGRDPYLAKGMGSRPNSFHTTEAAEKNGHPCPKPVGQMKWLVNRASLEGETVLDPFMGSGTTGVACVELGRRFVGIELEPEYFEIACRRIEKALRQPDMFIKRPAAPKQEAMF